VLLAILFGDFPRFIVDFGQAIQSSLPFLQQFCSESFGNITLSSTDIAIALLMSLNFFIATDALGHQEGLVGSLVYT